MGLYRYKAGHISWYCCVVVVFAAGVDPVSVAVLVASVLVERVVELVQSLCTGALSDRTVEGVIAYRSLSHVT